MFSPKKVNVKLSLKSRFHRSNSPIIGFVNNDTENLE